jgi:hypothetical protein
MLTKMKKSFLVFLVVLGTIALFGSTNAFADVICASATITKTGPVSTGTGRVLVILRNDSGAAVGSWPAGTQRQFFMNDLIKNQGLAVLLTAFSLDKKVWVSIADLAEMNKEVQIVYLNK